MSAIDCAGQDGRAHCGFKIGARHDNEGIAAAKLEHAFFDLARGCACYRAAGTLAAGKRDRFDALIDDHFFGLSRFNQQCLKNTVVESGATKYLLNRERALWHVGRVFEQSHIPRHQGRRCESKDLPERKIPRHDREDWTKRLITHITSRRVRLRGLIFQKTLCILGVKSANARTFHDFIHRAAQ